MFSMNPINSASFVQLNGFHKIYIKCSTLCHMNFKYPASKNYYNQRRIKRGTININENVFVYNTLLNHTELHRKWNGSHIVKDISGDHIHVIEMSRNIGKIEKWLPRERLRLVKRNKEPPIFLIPISPDL